MIKVTYYIGTCDKDSCKKELSDRNFYKVFDELFVNYTLQKVQGVYTMQNSKTAVKEDTFIVTTFITGTDIKQVNKPVLDNIHILKDKLNQESILVEVTEVTTMFL